MGSASSSNQAALKIEPSLKMQLRPAFRCCGIPNPAGLTNCPSCRAPAIPPTDFDADAVLVLQWPERACFAIAAWLIRMAKRIEGVGK